MIAEVLRVGTMLAFGGFVIATLIAPSCAMPTNEAQTIRELMWPETTPERGALRLRFRLEGIADTWSLPTRATGETAQVILADTPVVQLNLNVTRQKTTLHLFFPASAAENGPWVRGELAALSGLVRERALGQLKVGALDLSHLRGGQPYELLVAWDLPARVVRVFLNGVEQGDVFPANKGDWTPAPRTERVATAGGRLMGTDVSVPVRVEQVEVISGAIDASRAAALADGLPAISGEGRMEADGPLDLSRYELHPLHTPDLANAKVIAESELFDEHGQRVRAPVDDEWVLEGPGKAARMADSLRLETRSEGGAREATAARGHLVLWAPYELPDRVLVEYLFTPQDARRGLHILFWSARGADGESLFADGRRRRDGVFGEYLWRGLNSYHASIFATDDDTPRRVANLRKNDGFVLVACGDDRVAGHGAGPFRVRLLKDGPRNEIEVDGRRVLRFTDDGRANGSALGGGRLGFRLMAHTGSAEIAGLRIYSLNEKDDSTP